MILATYTVRLSWNRCVAIALTSDGSELWAFGESPERARLAITAGAGRTLEHRQEPLSPRHQTVIDRLLAAAFADEEEEPNA